MRFRPLLDRFLYQKASVFSASVAVSVLFRTQFSVFGKNKIGFLDLLFDAVRCFSGFNSENMHLKDLNRVHVFSDFACGFRF